MLKALCASDDKAWDGLCRLPRQAPNRVKLATYFAWCDSGVWLRRPSYLFFGFLAAATYAIPIYISQLGSHDLAVGAERWQDHGPRCKRSCGSCSMYWMGVVDDEQHLVFECPAIFPD